MIPETRQRRRIELWRAERFPERWVFDRVMLENVNCVDTTWLQHDGRFWLLAGAGTDAAGSSDELHVFHSPSPFGPWQPHQKNPVATTTRGARPAGRVFMLDQQLVRPAQDCAKVYGHRVRFFRIDELSEDNFRETEIGAIEADWLPGNIGTHTFNFDDKYEVIDGRVRVLRGFRLRRRRRASA